MLKALERSYTALNSLKSSELLIKSLKALNSLQTHEQFHRVLTSHQRL